jgi:hypothetical protein
LISVLGSYVDVARIRESARKCHYIGSTGLGAARAETPARIWLMAKMLHEVPPIIRWLSFSFWFLSELKPSFALHSTWLVENHLPTKALLVDDDIQKRTVNSQFAVIFDKSTFTETIHK